MASTQPRPVTGLEAWLIGATDELDAAERALDTVVVIFDRSARTPAGGARWRMYIRGQLRTAPTPELPPGPAPSPLSRDDGPGGAHRSP